jgi:tRNA-Thr(GGU) m(6)t(6)A37 methyltransferase TsaA
MECDGSAGLPVAKLAGLRAGGARGSPERPARATRVIVITWLDRARRDVLSVHPRGDASSALEGVFSTRSPHRPNLIGLHTVVVTAVDGRRVRVRSLEALDGTPIINVKPILGSDVGQR